MQAKMEDEYGAENLEDGELWLPSDFFSMDENVEEPNQISSSSSSWPSIFQPHNSTLCKPLQSLQRFKPAICCGFTHDFCNCEARNRWTGFSAVHRLPRMNPVQNQIEAFMGERYWALQKQQQQLNRVAVNRVLPGVGMSSHGGTGVFLPRTSTNMLTAIVAKNYNHHRVRKGQPFVDKNEIQLPPRKILIDKRRDGYHGYVQQ